MIIRFDISSPLRIEYPGAWYHVMNQHGDAGYRGAICMKMKLLRCVVCMTAGGVRRWWGVICVWRG